MRHKRLLFLLGIECIVLVMVHINFEINYTFLSDVLALPFGPIGMGLRGLSLSGNIGNGLAVMIWVGISFLPVLFAWTERSVHNALWERVTLYALGIVLGLGLYFMVNPESLLSVLSEREMDVVIPVLKAILGSAIWSVIMLWLVFKGIRIFKASNIEKLFDYFKHMLYGFSILFVAMFVFYVFSDLLISIEESETYVQVVIAVFRFLVSGLPYGLSIAIIILSLDLIDVVKVSDGFGIHRAAKRLSQCCCYTLGLITASGAILNLIQLILIQHLTYVHISLNLPFISLAFVLGVLVLARLIQKNQELLEQDALFI